MATKATPAPTSDEPAPARTTKKTAAPEPAPAPEPAAEYVNEVRETPEVEPSKRRMPDNLRRYLIRLQGNKLYLPAAYRIVWFRDAMGDEWGIRTEVIEGGHAAGFATVHAEILNPEGRVIASGHKTESKEDFPAGWVEKAESGSVARALALLGFGTQFMPELDDDGSRPADSPQRRHHYIPPRPVSEARPPVNETRAPVSETRPPENGLQEEGDGRPAAPMTTAARPLTATADVWEGPGQCPRCHAPEGRRHAKPCI